MADDRRKSNEDKLVDEVEFKVGMYCSACERTVAKAINEIEGVEKSETDMDRHRVLIKGKINPEKVSKELAKKTGKKVEIVINKERSGDLPKKIEKDSSHGEGVEKSKTDMDQQRVPIKGKINPEKVSKELETKTEKKAEIVINKESSGDPPKKKEEDSSLGRGLLSTRSMVPGYSEESALSFTMFSDDNPHACSVM